MAARKRKKQPSPCPIGWHPAGHSVPVHLTVKQQAYSRRAIGVARFVYNLCVATHRFHRTNRLPWPSWQDLSKAFNTCKHEDYSPQSKWATGRYWVYVYDGERKVAEVAYEITP